MGILARIKKGLKAILGRIKGIVVRRPRVPLPAPPPKPVKIELPEVKPVKIELVKPKPITVKAPPMEAFIGVESDTGNFIWFNPERMTYVLRKPDGRKIDEKDEIEVEESFSLETERLQPPRLGTGFTVVESHVRTRMPPIPPASMRRRLKKIQLTITDVVKTHPNMSNFLSNLMKVGVEFRWIPRTDRTYPIAEYNFEIREEHYTPRIYENYEYNVEVEYARIKRVLEKLRRRK